MNRSLLGAIFSAVEVSVTVFLVMLTGLFIGAAIVAVL